MSGKSRSEWKSRNRFSSVFILFAAAVCFWAILSLAHATTFYVSVDTGDDTTGDGSQAKPWKTLVKALDTALAGTETSPTLLLMAVGTYPENVSIKKNWTTVQGGYEPTSWTLALAPAATVVDGRKLLRVIAVGAGLDGTTLKRLTVINGKDGYGGGIYSPSALSAFDCNVRDCEATGDGGGVQATDQRNVLVNCVLSGNNAQGFGGGFQGSGTFENCVIENNRSVGAGGAGISGTHIDISGSLLSGNSAGTSYKGGGGCWIDYGSLTDCRVVGNSADIGGGVYGSYLTLTRCEILQNSSRFSGGAGGHHNLAQYCTFSLNHASMSGGGLYLAGTLNFCTVAHNSAAYGGGCFNDSTYGDTTINNSLIYCNQSGSGGGLEGRHLLFGCVVSDNTSSGDGGGAHSGYSSVTIEMTDCLVTRNSAGGNGGAFFGKCQMTRCNVFNNQCGSNHWGGGIYDQGGSALVNCLIWGNPGGGVAIQSGTVKHCTIVDNPRGLASNGIGVRILGPGPSLINNLIAGHEMNIAETSASSDPAAVRNNLLSDSSVCQYWANGATALNTAQEINNLLYAQGNLVSPSPGLLDRPGGDFHLDAQSPAIDAASAADSVADDYDHNPRPFGPAPDIGAYELGYPLPPQWPVNPWPADGAANVDVHNLILQWGAAARATQYDVYVWPADTVRPDTPTTSGVAGTACAVALSPATDYWWQVVARNDVGVAPGDVWAFRTETNTPPGPPSLDSVTDQGEAVAQLAWSCSGAPSAQFLGFAWDIYLANWVCRFWNDSMWQPFAASDTVGAMDLGYSGAYHVWISSQFFDGYWIPCANPWTGILYSGTPHPPCGASVESLGGVNVRLHWSPEIYGTWHDQIIAYKVGEGFVSTAGPSGNQLWHFIDYGQTAYDTSKASFMNGWADFTLPSAGDYWFLIRGIGWLPPYPAGDCGAGFAHVGP
ncbi:MAG: right-handed parallel beta-helix repeat-containing protein [Candidatus Sumerlaeota bacterium]|nr:right-handed parallel beta-helix repeat-containing protein [Candidatus Sumerlaeota bacterium]